MTKKATKKSAKKAVKKKVKENTKHSTDYYKKMLLEKKARILGDVDQLQSETLKNSQREASGDLSAYSLHMADLGSDAAERELMLQLASSEQKQLQNINHALERIENGTYGTCELCGCVISHSRLEAIPEATICITCMKKYDL
jgi:DnaK suppressor protein